VQNAAGNDRMEGPRIVELLERHPAVEGAIRSVGVDRQDLVARSRKGGSYAPLVSTAHLEHATWWLRQL